MAALPEAQTPELLELSQVRVADLDVILLEETRVWRRQLDWDFSPSADLVRRFVEARALSGHALLVDGEPAGYCYYVCEERKGLIGDLYMRERFRSAGGEQQLLGAALCGMMRTPGVRRIESQLMLYPLAGPPPPVGGDALRLHSRNLMSFDLARAKRLPPRNLSGDVLLDQWTERKQDETAQLIAAAYHGHIDGEINDQYRSVVGARRFLFNIVQYPGCGRFFPPAAGVALSRETGRVCGVSLTSMVAEDVGHITQICVTPGVRGTGVGYELLRRSLAAFAEAGCRKVSLTVTTANREAVRLYEQAGFVTVHQFPAMVWDGF